MKLILDFVFITAFLFNVLILFLLAKNSSKELHKRILQVIFIFIALTLSSGYAYLHKIKFLFYFTFIFDDSITTFIGPLLLLYVKAIFLPNKGLIKRNLKHFIIPFIYFIVGTIPSLISTYTKVYLFTYIATYENYLPLIIVYSLIYCFMAFRVTQRAEEVIKHNYANTDTVDLTWIKRLLIGAICVISIDVLSTLYELWFGILKWNTLYLTAIGIIILVVYLGIHGVLQSKIFISPFLLENVTPVTSDKDKKKSTLPLNYSQTELLELEQRLNNIMKFDKPYLDENLTLKSLADLLGTTDKKLSAILNQHIQASFYDYVNGFKVQNVIEKMKDASYDKFTLLSIAFESGFNSKTSFNRIFKNTTKLSPSEYKKQLNKLN